MKRQNIVTLVLVGFVAAFLSSFVAKALFNPAKHHREKVPVVQAINSNFPQISTDKDYKTFFNSQALDPTQLIKIGTSQNNTPFNSGP